MPTSYTTNLRLALPATGELAGIWGTVVNDNITKMIEEAITGIATINTWLANAHTLTEANGTTSEARCAALNLTGALSATGTLLVPDAVAKTYIIQNNTSGGYAVTIQRISGGNSVTVPNGNTCIVYTDGADIGLVTPFFSNTGQLTGNVTGTASNVTGIVAVANGGTGSSSTAGALDNLLPGGEIAGYVLTTSGPGTYYWGPGGGGGGSGSGTTITTSRSLFTATSGQTVFSGLGTYVIGAGQVRVYINGVRLFPADYTETSTTSITLTTGAVAGDEVMIEIDGYNTFALTAAATSFTPVGTIASTDVQNAIAELDADLTNYFPSGTKMLFQQTAAPTGWTKDTTHNNNALRVVTGTVGSGGSLSFTSAFASRTISGSTDGTTLTIDQIPSHNHPGNFNNEALSNAYVKTGAAGEVSMMRGFNNVLNTSNVPSQGGGQAHSHTLSAASLDLAVQYVDLIIATKN